MSSVAVLDETLSLSRKLCIFIIKKCFLKIKVFYMGKTSLVMRMSVVRHMVYIQGYSCPSTTVIEIATVEKHETRYHISSSTVNMLSTTTYRPL